MNAYNEWHKALAFAYGRKVISGQQLAAIIKIYRENQVQGELDL